MKKLYALLLSILITSALATTYALAQEGMWIPLLLKDLNEKEMQSMGMKMTAKDIYSVNEGSLKDAIVHFGGFCTSEVISDQGLLLTNHHCGYGQIQNHSSLENNYIEDGFWAKDLSEELPNPGLFARFIIRIEDVTEKALEGVDESMSSSDRQSAIDKNINTIKKNTEKEAYQEVMVKPFYEGNQYFLFVTETYNDVRLVGTPPNSIGKFGSDTDNWVWPRHTGDFSLFRIYASKDNKPADYSADNVPYKPRHYLPVSIKGVKENDFTLVFGFPGRTQEYLPASAVDMMVNKLNPIRINIRTKSLSIIDDAMKENPEARIQYASKQARIANGWKKWIGESKGIKKTNAIKKKQNLETQFKQRIKYKPEWKEAYTDLLPTMDSLYKKLTPYAKARDNYNEFVWRNVELLYVAGVFEKYYEIYENNGMKALNEKLPQLINFLEDFYKDFRPETDEKIMLALFEEVYLHQLGKEFRSQFVIDQVGFASGNVEELVKRIYLQSNLSKGKTVLKTLKNDPKKFFKALKGDFAFQIRHEMGKTADEKIFGPYNKINSKIKELQRKYMKAQMEVFPEKRFYPDANSTMRVTYGTVRGYSPDENIQYDYQTWLSGVMEKYKPGDYEFDVPEKLSQLYIDKDYGPYGENGKMPVCFIGSNHTTGGNSGSPAINANGELVGLNFDRVWEGTMSDLNYDESICRNIMVDIRYILFIIDKYAGAGHLVEEMDLVK